MKALQTFTPEYLDLCKKMKPEQIVQFLEDFRILNGSRVFEGESKLISIKVSNTLLETFRKKCELNHVPYQTQIKLLMKDWLISGSSR